MAKWNKGRTVIQLSYEPTEPVSSTVKWGQEQ